jgi:PAS domain S-box-containing protein
VQIDRIFNIIKDGILAADIATKKFVACNEAICRMLGYEREELLTLGVRDIHPQERLQAVLQEFDERLIENRPSDIAADIPVRRKDGTVFYADINASRITLDGRDCLVGVFRDITRRNLMGKEILLNEERFETLFKLSQMTSASEEEIISFALEEVVRLTESRVGYLHFINEDIDTIRLYYWSKDVLKGCSADKGSAHYPIEKAGVWADCVRARKPVVHNDYQNLPDKKGLPDGHFPVLRHMSIPILDEDKIVAVAGVGNKNESYDETDIRQLQLFMNDMWKLLKEKRADEFIRNILQNVDEAFIVIDRNYRIISANKAYLDMVGKPLNEVLWKRCYELSHRFNRPCYEEGDVCAVKHVFETGEPSTAVHIHLDGNNNPIHVETKSFPIKDSAGNVISAIEIINDISEKRRLEEQLRQAQKMEAIGQLAGGIAHDFNNMLTAIVGYAGLLDAKIERDNMLKSYVEQILSASEKATNLTRSLLAFSRKQVMEFKPIDINDTVKGIEKMLKRFIGEDIELKAVLPDKDIVVMADRGQIEQVLINLATNARDAMPDGGMLTIETGIFRVTRNYLKGHLFNHPGNYAVVSVTDSGIGMDEYTKEKIFEPFFSTKELGRGTGLGLSIVYGIIKQHNGNINVYSEPGKGTTFKIFLPLVYADKYIEERTSAAAIRGGNETILVAEDELVVRAVIKVVLEGAGYKVIEAADGDEGLMKFKEHGDDIQAVLTDLVMPKMNGRDLCDAIKKLNPEIKILFMSGYADDIVYKKGMLDYGVSFISKPIPADGLLKKIREILDETD